MPTRVIVAIQRRYASGETLRSIAQSEHVSYTTVRKYVKALPSRQAGHHLPPETVSAIQTLRAKGHKQIAIAKKLGVSVTSVRRHEQASGEATPRRRGRPRKTAADIAR